MKNCTATLQFISPYSQGRFHNTPKLNKEGSAEYEERTWIEKAHWKKVDGKELMTIPGMAIKQAIEEAAKRLGTPAPGKTAKSTMTKYFKSGLMIFNDPVLNITREDVNREECFIPSSSAGNNRVTKYFPIVETTEENMPTFTVDFVILDDIITKSTFEEHLRYAGRYIGIGRFRIGNGGPYGRFEIENINFNNIVE